MADLGIPQIGTPLIDPNGRISRPWWIFFQGLFDRVGGVQGSSADDLALSMPEDAGIEEVKADLYSLRNSVDVAPQFNQASEIKEDPSARLEALEALVSELTRQVDDLKKGTLA